MMTLASGNPLNHVVQHIQLKLGEGFFTFPIISNHVIMQMAAFALTLWVIPRAIRSRAGTDEIGRLVPTGLGNAIELVCEFLRVNIARPVLGEHTDRFIPYIWSAFYFVLFSNLLGLIPLSDWTWFIGGGHILGGTSTGNIWVTAALASCTLVLIIYNGLRFHGMAYVSHFFLGPFPLNILIGVLEIVGLFMKPFALAVRLFANMLAGHVLLAVLLSFIEMAFHHLPWGGGLIITVVVIAASIAINFLELFVAFLQAFIFAFLSAVFIGQAVNIHHHDDHGHEEGHAGGHDAAHGHAHGH